MTEEAAGNKRRQNKLLSDVPTPILDAYEERLDVSRHMMETLMSWGRRNPKVRDDLFKLKSMRNRVVHDIVKSTKKDAKFAIPPAGM